MGVVDSSMADNMVPCTSFSLLFCNTGYKNTEEVMSRTDKLSGNMEGNRRLCRLKKYSR